MTLENQPTSSEALLEKQSLWQTIKGKLGSDAIATVGLTESLLTVIYTISIRLSIGVKALVARRTGDNDTQCAAKIAGQALLLEAAVPMGMGPFGAFLAITISFSLFAVFSTVIFRKGHWKKQMV